MSAIIPTLDEQFLYNSDPYLRSRPVRGKRDVKRIEEPIILWRREYETNQASFFEVIEKLSNYMLLNRSGIFSKDNPNTEKLIDAVRGKLDAKDYFSAEFTYGEQGLSPIRNNNFFYGAKTLLMGEVIGQPLKFSSKNVSNEYSNDQVKKRAKMGAKLAINLLAELAAEEGVDMEFVKDKKINMSGTKDEIFSRLKDHEKLENIIYKLLQKTNYDHDILSLAKHCFDTKFDINAEFAMIEVVNGDVIPKPLEPWQVSYISAKRKLETLEDPSVVAASAIDYLSFTELINKYGMRLNTGTGSAGLLDAIKKIQEGNLGWYDPQRSYFSEYYKASNVTSDYESDYSRNLSPYKEDAWLRINHMNGTFYPFQRGAEALSYSILEQKMYFQMIVPSRYVVEFDGKKPTQTQWDKWVKDDYSRELDPAFTEIGLGEKAPKGSFVVDKPKNELWEATRLGHGTLIDVGRYKYTSDSTVRSNYVGMPIVMQVSYDESLAFIGYNYAIWTNVAMSRVEEIINRFGPSRAILIDQASGMDPVSFMYNAKKAGIAMFNSMKINGANPATQKHLDIIDLGNDAAMVNDLLSYCGMWKIAYENMVGASPQAQGQTQAYVGKGTTELNIANQGVLKKVKYWEHSQFMNQVLQRTADILKIVYAKDELINITVSTGEKELLRLSKDLSLADFDIHLESGNDLNNKKGIIDAAVSQVLASGGIDMIEPLIEILITDNPSEALAIFRKNHDKVIKMQAAQAEAQQQQMQVQAQLEQQKNNIPLHREEMVSQTAIEVQRMKMQERANSEDLKGNLVDIKHANEKENRVIDADLDMTRESHRAALQDGVNANQSIRQSQEAPVQP